MHKDSPHFDEYGRLIAPRYDDVYFSAEDGLAETEHVFLRGNDLSKRFAVLPPGGCFTIGETGFGTGLNLLAVWQLFEQHAPADARLEFVSVEAAPLDAGTIERALSPWPELASHRDALFKQWGPIWPGMHRFRFADGRVRLTLLVGEATESLASIDTSVDAWFLDGFAPSRNPDMWSEAVFKQVARLSANEATLATYTAAGFVRRGLEAAGFAVEKQPGFGTKRDMTAGRFTGAADQNKRWGSHSCLPSAEGRSAVVIGGSLAGAFAARSLAERGVSVTLIERQALSQGELPTLSPRVAVLQPKINDINDPAGAWLREGYAFVERWLGSDPLLAERCGWQACGTFQAAYDERGDRRLRRFVEQLGQTGLCRWVDPEQTQEEVGRLLSCGGVLIERAGILRPAGLCAALLDHPQITILDSTPARSLQRAGRTWTISHDDDGSIQAKSVVIANALDALHFDQTKHLELKPVRGQVTLFETQVRRLTSLRRALFFGGYILPPVNGVQTLGASFVPGDDASGWRDAEHADVCNQLARICYEEAEQLRAIDKPTGWVGSRTTTPGHRCYAEQIDEGLYVSLGHGSHGIASAAQAGEQLAAQIIDIGTLRVAR